MKNKIDWTLLTILSDGKFHSGEALGEYFGITRAAIWKYIRALKELGLEIESISKKGYRLLNPIEWLDKTRIKNQLEPHLKNHLDNMIILKEIDSTNNYLMSLAKSQPYKNIACYAEKQTHGRGRHGRQWISPLGTNLYLSYLCYFQKDPAEIVGLSLAIGLAVVRALKHYGLDADIRLKWPNDVLWHQKKLAGILIDTLAVNHVDSHVIIGIGINTTMSSQQAANIDQAWTCLAEMTEHPIERNKLAGLLLNELIKTVEEFKQHGLSYFIDEWKKLDDLIGKPVSIRQANTDIQGVLKDINQRGELIVLTPNNEQRHFLSGEVSLRRSNDRAASLRGAKRFSSSFIY